MSDYIGPTLEDNNFSWSLDHLSPKRASMMQQISLNLSGTSFQISQQNLLHYPETRLGKLAKSLENREIDSNSEPLFRKTLAANKELEKLCDRWLPESNECYFERSPFTFDAILNLYRHGTIHIPEGQCPLSFLNEMHYWGIEKGYVASCCSTKLEFYEQHLREQQLAADQLLTGMPAKSAAELRKKSSIHGLGDYDDEDADLDWHMECNKHGCLVARKKVWRFLEYPKSSKPAMVFTALSLTFVVATVVILIMSSIPHFQHVDPISNETSIDYGLEVADTVCVAWFTAEHIVRIWSTPDRLAYLRTPLCNIDFFAIAPFYIELVLSFLGIESKMFGELRRSLLMMRILRALRVMRVLRVLKVARYSKGFQSVGATLKKCWKELIMLVLFMFTTNVMFSTVMYFMENDNGTPGFQSIPAASWWCIITMTTVGYGDVCPKTIPGKIFAGIVSITGIILLAFPISVIVEHFHEEYSDDGRQDSAIEGFANGQAPKQTIRVFTGLFMCEVPAKQRRHTKTLHI